MSCCRNCAIAPILSKGVGNEAVSALTFCFSSGDASTRPLVSFRYQSPICCQLENALAADPPGGKKKITILPSIPAHGGMSSSSRTPFTSLTAHCHSLLPPGVNEWQWAVSDVKGVREEEDMPPWAGIEGRMVIFFFPPGGSAASAFSNWQQMGDWYLKLTNGRVDASPELKQKVSALTASLPTPLDKMGAIAQFLQHDIRYVAIELGIGGFQPHPASQVFAHRYGDCKDKATLMAAMLHEIGVDSYYVVLNARRGSVTAETPAQMSAFNHVILALKVLPAVRY